jgi:membrane-anchored mycosin MYCP
MQQDRRCVGTEFEMTNSQEARAVKRIGVAPDELVVGLAEWPLVAAALSRLHVWPAGKPPTEQDEGLGLALATGLSDMDGAAAWIRAKHGPRLAGLENAAGHPYEAIDVVLYELRRHFRETLAGYVPPLGKSRTGYLVVGSPYPKGITAATLPSAALPPAAPAADERAGAAVRVGVLDTPVSAHPDLAGRYVTSRPGDVLLPAAAGAPHSWRAGHGTFVADLIRRQAPAVQLETRGLLDSETGRATLWDTALAIMRLGNSGIDVLNLSLACLTEDDEPPLLLRRALDRIPPDVVVIAAAGNHGTGAEPVWPAWPAALDGVVAVGATNAAFSAYGPWVTCSAPGENLTAAYPVGTVSVADRPHPQGTAELTADATGVETRPAADAENPDFTTGYARWSGTSFAAAWATGAVAARTVPGRVPAREALRQLLADPASGVKPVHFQSS